MKKTKVFTKRVCSWLLRLTCTSFGFFLLGISILVTSVESMISKTLRSEEKHENHGFSPKNLFANNPEK